MHPMAVFVFMAAAVEAVFSMPQTPKNKIIPLLQRDEHRDDSGFSLRYVTGDGITLTEVGKFKQSPDGKESIFVKEGSYSYTSPEGKTFHLAYVADENGFRPIAGHKLETPMVEK